MASPFDKYTLNKAREQIPPDRDMPVDETAGILTPMGYAANRRLYDGDHWLDTAGWIGPRPGAGDTDSTNVLLEIRRAFISKNAVREVVDRHVGGVMGKEPSWKFTVRRPLGKVEQQQPDGTMKTVDEEPNEAEQALIDEAETALTEWWDARGAHTLIQDVAATLLLARRGALRLFVPPGLVEQDGVTGAISVPVTELTPSLMRIYVKAPDPAQATVVTDENTQQQAGIFLYRDDESKADRAELVYLDDAGQTLIRILGATDTTAAAPLDLGGRLTIYEMTRAALITPQVRQLQALLNMALTMLGRNVVLAGFLERILLNVQLPGVYEGEGAARRFVPDTFRVGAGTTNALMGATYVDEQGITRMASPSVVYRDPVPVDTFKATKEEAYTAILEETDQLHAQISGDATASGESRKQARADFEQSLLDTQAQLNRAGRWLLETVLAMGAAFAGTPGRFAELRAVFECRVDAGPMAADELRLLSELSGSQQLLSRETAMARVGVDDVDAEQERIASEEEAKQARALAIAQAQAEIAPPTGNGVPLGKAT